MKDERPMKLFVWHDIGCNYGSGMAFAIAENLEQAIAAIEKNSGMWDIGPELEAKIPEIRRVTVPYGCAVEGGT